MRPDMKTLIVDALKDRRGDDLERFTETSEKDTMLDTIQASCFAESSKATPSFGG